MSCELCDADNHEYVVDSPVIPWTKIPMCEDCHDDYQEGREITASVTRIDNE